MLLCVWLHVVYLIFFFFFILIVVQCGGVHYILNVSIIISKVKAYRKQQSYYTLGEQREKKAKKK